MSGNPCDDKTFEILVREHHRRVLAYALSLVRREDVAQDLVQEAFLVAHRKLPEFDSSRDFGNWLRGIVRLEYLEWTRRQREVPFSDNILNALEARYREWDDAGGDGRTEIFEALQLCLQNLQDMARRTIDLFYTERRSCADIGDQMGASEPVVRKRLERARQSLLQCISKRMAASEVMA